ncbi:hypothetical protein FDP41_002538 [Naegleria fowleri]|uniref:UBC core domain-containing protein n=1 Tax=Naegleria fowleri TaxID=5763 RepID=A0A6A5BYC4_NAEFO|nr:uncharacterized protein FDP41_002538 [Naegleria fowleri]KAF0978718.1 hypothetical protein FDP41_002538 [Naegleria fowleri]
MTGLKAEAEKFLNNAKENTFGWTLKENSTDDKIYVVVDNEADPDDNPYFSITKNGDSFKVASQYYLLEEVEGVRFIKLLSDYCAQGKRSLTDVLQKANSIYSQVESALMAGEEQGDDEDQEEVEIEVGEDMQDDMPVQPVSSMGSGYDANFEEMKKKFKKPQGASEGCINCIMKEYMKIKQADVEKLGISANPVNDDLFHWEIRFFKFDPKEDGQIAKDLAEYSKKFGIDYITLDLTFPLEFPFKPPFIRVLKPRFAFRTGHVTIGGSICMELLTSSGWSSVCSLESIFVQIRTEMIAGEARLDFSNTTPYTEHEAKEAFFRVAERYGWEKR